MTELTLSGKERDALTKLAAETNDARVLRRVQALLWLSTDESAQQVAARLGVTRQTIYNWVMRFQERGRVELIQRVADAPRDGRPRTAQGVIEPLIDAVIHDDPRDLGYRSTVWTAPLLVEHLRKTHQVDVSCSSVRNAIARLRIRWKRPRHNLALRARTWRQAKGG